MSLHVIHPCACDEALFHPQPWPSAMRVLEGRYEMIVGAGRGEDAPPVVTRLRAGPGFEYEMTHPDGWHAVRAVDAPALTLMVTGAPWDRWSPGVDQPLGPLPAVRVSEILRAFRAHYPRA